MDGKIEVREYEGSAATNVNQMLQLLIGVFIITLLGVLTNVMSAKVIAIGTPEVEALNDTQLKETIKTSNLNYIKANTSISSYVPLIILVVIIALVVHTILSSFGGVAGFGDYGYGGYIGGRFL